METKQMTESEQKVNSEQSKKVIPDAEINTPDNKNGEGASSGIGTILKRIWVYVLQNPGGTSGWAVAIVMFLTFAYNIYNNKTQVDLKTIEGIVKIVQDVQSEEREQFEESIQKIEQDPKASVMNKAVVEAYKLKQVGKIDESIEKWRSIANIAEGTDNDLAAGAWFAVGSLYTPEDEKDEDISVHTFDKSIFLPGYLDKPFRPTMSYVGQNVNRDVIEKAISSYDQAIRLKSDFLEAYLNRGLAKYALDKYDEAITDYNKVIQLEPDFAGVYSNRGIAKSALGKHKEAIADHDKAIHLKPDLVIAYNNRGVAKSALGQRESAIIDYNETIRLKPDFAGVYSNRGTAKAALGQYESALADHNKAIRLNPDLPKLYVARAM